MFRPIIFICNIATETFLFKLNLFYFILKEDSSKVLTASQSLELAKPKKRLNKKSEQKEKGNFYFIVTYLIV